MTKLIALFKFWVNVVGEVDPTLGTVNDPIITAFEDEARYLNPIKLHALKNVDTLN